MIKQLALKFNTYSNYKKDSNVISSDLDRTILRSLLITFGVLALIYIVILGSMVSNILARRSSELQARALSSEVGDLELTYLSMSKNIDLPLSYSLGYKEAKATFATRKNLSLRTEIDRYGNVKIIQNEL